MTISVLFLVGRFLFVVPFVMIGVDRVVAVFGDGRAYAWHQLNGKLEE